MDNQELFELDEALNEELNNQSSDHYEDIMGQLEIAEYGEEPMTNGQALGKAVSNLTSRVNNANGFTPKSVLEETLQQDKTLNITPQNLHLFTEVVFPNQTEVTQAKSARQLFSSTLDNAVETYKALEEANIAEELKRIESHNRSIASLNEKHSLEFEQQIAKLSNQIQILDKSMMEPGADTISIQSYRNSAVSQVQALQREFAVYRLNSILIQNFLTAYRNLYADYRRLEIEHKYQNPAILKDLDVDGDVVTFKCDSCGTETVSTYEKLPKTLIGKTTYELDIKQHILNFAKVANAKLESLYTEALRVLMTGVEALADENLKAQVENTHNLISKVMGLYSHQGVRGAMSQEANTYLEHTLLPQLKNDPRVPLFKLLFELMLPSTPMAQMPSIHYMAPVFSNISQPTVLNVLKHTHPLCSRQDLINRYPAEYNQQNGTSIQAEYQIYANDNYALGEFLLSKFEKCFSYPNPDVYELRVLRNSQGKEDTSSSISPNASGHIPLDKESSLRLQMQPQCCSKCKKILLYPTAVVNACKIYSAGKSASVDIKSLATESSLNLLSLLTPSRVPKLKVDTPTRTSKATSYQRVAQQKTTATYHQISNLTAQAKTATSKDAVFNSISKVQQVKHDYGLVSESLAIKMCEALESNNPYRIQEVQEENKLEIARLQGVPQPVPQEEPIQEQIQETQVQETLETEEPTIQSYMAEYGDVDLDTLSYEELISKGYYNYNNLIRLYGLNPASYQTPEEILFAISGDDATIAQLPRAIREKLETDYTITDGIPDELIDDDFLL